MWVLGPRSRTRGDKQALLNHFNWAANVLWHLPQMKIVILTRPDNPAGALELPSGLVEIRSDAWLIPGTKTT